MYLLISDLIISSYNILFFTCLHHCEKKKRKCFSRKGKQDDDLGWGSLRILRFGSVLGFASTVRFYHGFLNGLLMTMRG